MDSSSEVTRVMDEFRQILLDFSEALRSILSMVQKNIDEDNLPLAKDALQMGRRTLAEVAAQLDAIEYPSDTKEEK